MGPTPNLGAVMFSHCHHCPVNQVPLYHSPSPLTLQQRPPGTIKQHQQGSTSREPQPPVAGATRSSLPPSKPPYWVSGQKSQSRDGQEMGQGLPSTQLLCLWPMEGRTTSIFHLVWGHCKEAAGVHMHFAKHGWGCIWVWVCPTGLSHTHPF